MTKFVAQPGQIDYTHVRWTPVINCVVKFADKILLVKRSEKLRFYPGYWNGISGFLDDQKNLEEKVYEELREELQLDRHHISSIKFGQVFDQEEAQYNKTWIVHPVLVVVNTDHIRTDWESQSYSWMTVHKVRQQKLLPGFDRVLNNFFNGTNNAPARVIGLIG